MAVMKQILSNLICDDNRLRSRYETSQVRFCVIFDDLASAEGAVNEKLAETPIGFNLAHLARNTDQNEVVLQDMVVVQVTVFYAKRIY
jgi:hypothetical protein